jgi:hypothetical protein
MSATYQQLMAIDERLAAHGVPPLGAWWRDLLGRWYAGPALTLAVCAGRGSAKSTALYKVALVETLFGPDPPPGEVHWASLTSRHKDEAAKGVATISQWLTMLGVEHDPRDGVIEIQAMRRGIRITAASVAGATGWRSFFDGNDEVGKWATDGALTVDAVEVLASKRAMTATHPRARHWIGSTPLIAAGPFFEIVSAGSNEHTLVAQAPTWIATDGRISEERTRDLEPSERIRIREYGAEFGEEWEHGYFGDLPQACVGEWSSLPRAAGHKYAVAIDPAFSRDLFAICVAHAEGDTVIVDRIEAITPPSDGTGLSPTECLRRARARMVEYGAKELLSDQFSGAALKDLAAREDIAIALVPWTALNKAPRFEATRSLMRDQRLRLANDRGLLRELGGISTHTTPSGHERIEARPGFTDDRVAALVLAVSSVTEKWKPANKLVAALRNKIAAEPGPRTRFDPDGNPFHRHGWAGQGWFGRRW